MKKPPIIIAAIGAIASLVLIVFSRLSMELDKRIPFSIALSAALLLGILVLFGRRLGRTVSVLLAVVGLFLAFSSLFVVRHHWRPRSQAEDILRDLRQLPTPSQSP